MIHLVNIPIDQRLELYDRAITLFSGGNTASQVAKSLNLNVSTVWRWTYTTKNPRNRVKNLIDSTPIPDLAWFLGFTMGDGTARIKRKPNGNYNIIAIQLPPTEAALINEWERAYNSFGIGKVSTYTSFPHGSKTLVAEVISRHLYEFLKPYQEGNLSPFKNIIKTFPYDFIAGLIDSDGCVRITKERYNNYCHIGFTNTNQALIHFLRELLNNLGLHPTLYLQSKAGEGIPPRVFKKDCFHLELNRQLEVAWFAKNIPLRHPAKKEKLCAFF